MIPVIGINSSSAPFMAEIGARLKTLETRPRNTLGRFVGQRVYLAETKQGGYIAMYSAVIRSARKITTAEAWESLRPLHRVPAGNQYDWTPGTCYKWVYELSDLRRLRPFRVPEGRRHGRVWMEYEPPRRDRLKVIRRAALGEAVEYDLDDVEGHTVYGRGRKSNALYEIILDDRGKIKRVYYMF